MQPNDPGRDEVYVEWLAAAPKGVRWDKAQEMYALYQERRKEQAESVAKRLLGKSLPDMPNFRSALEEAKRLGLVR